MTIRNGHRCEGNHVPNDHPMYSLALYESIGKIHSLHSGSMISQNVKILPGKTIRLNLATTKTFNAD